MAETPKYPIGKGGKWPGWVINRLGFEGISVIFYVSGVF